jgi:hypothetical protein
MNGYAVTASAKYAEETDTRQMVKKPKKRQGWIKRLLSRSRIRDEVDSDLNLAIPSRLVPGDPQIDQPERAIQFTIYNANGGRVVETRRYDRQKDRNHTGLYVITSEKDFGHEIDKIITMEALRQ